MEAFGGIAAPDGASLTLYGLERMCRALEGGGLDFQRYSTEKAAMWSSGRTSLLVHRGVAIASQVRLDNREELLRSLDLREQEGIGDEELVVEAYLRFGRGCYERLLGDWTFALWDSRDRSLVLSRDHSGLGPLFYAYDGSKLAFSSCLKPLAALPWVPNRPNLLHVSKIVCAWPPDGVQTAYEGILRLPAAHTLVYKDGNVSMLRYWTLHQDSVSVGNSQDDIIEAFRELYSEAVRFRMRKAKRVGVTLSGGLDSSSVCALAAQEYRRTDSRLPTFTSVPKFPCPTATSGTFYDESPFVRTLQDAIPNLDVQWIACENAGLLADIDRAVDLIGEPLYWADNVHWMMEIFRLAEGQGIDMLLTGQMGNSTVSFAGFPQDTTMRIREHFLRTLARPIRDLYRRARQGNQVPMIAKSPINPRFAEEMDLVAERRRDPCAPDFRTLGHNRERQVAGINQALRFTDGSWHLIGAGYGLAVADPTCDKRIVEFCASVPLELFRRGTMGRWLVRGAMEGLVPDEVRLNQRKGAQSGDLARRIQEARPELNGAIFELEANSLASEVLDLAKMKRMLANIESYSAAEGRLIAGCIILRGIAAGRFLMRF